MICVDIICMLSTQIQSRVQGVANFQSARTCTRAPPCTSNLHIQYPKVTTLWLSGRPTVSTLVHAGALVHMMLLIVCCSQQTCVHVCILRLAMCLGLQLSGSALAQHARGPCSILSRYIFWVFLLFRYIVGTYYNVILLVQSAFHSECKQTQIFYWIIVLKFK